MEILWATARRANKDWNGRPGPGEPPQAVLQGHARIKKAPAGKNRRELILKKMRVENFGYAEILRKK